MIQSRRSSSTNLRSSGPAPTCGRGEAGTGRAAEGRLGSGTNSTLISAASIGIGFGRDGRVYSGFVGASADVRSVPGLIGTEVEVAEPVLLGDDDRPCAGGRVFGISS